MYPCAPAPYGRLISQSAVIPVHTDSKNNAAGNVCDGRQCKAIRQTDAFLHEAHQKRTDADADIIGKQIRRVGHAALGARCGACDKGLKQRLENTVPNAEEEPGRKQVDTGFQKHIAYHGDHQE